jgi:myosin heavy subunit
MSKIFGTLAAVILALSALIAFKNKEAKELEIVTYQDSMKVEKSTTDELNKLNKFLAGTQEEDLSAEAKEAEDALADVVKKHEDLKKEVVNLTESLESKKKEVASVEDLLKSLPNPDELVPKIKRMRASLAESQDALAAEEARLVSLAQRDKNGKARIKATREQLSMRSTGKSFPTLKTRINSVYRNWGFVILAAGDRQGVVTGSTLDVTRGGEVIAKLKVTAVESGRASADIVLDSVDAGVTVQVGDSVVAEQESEKTTSSTASK